MAEREGVTEQLKKRNQMRWVQRMNCIRERAEEIVREEIIYPKFPTQNYTLLSKL